jgi:hypothetical protein
MQAPRKQQMEQPGEQGEMANEKVGKQPSKWVFLPWAPLVAWRAGTKIVSYHISEPCLAFWIVWVIWSIERGCNFPC